MSVENTIKYSFLTRMYSCHYSDKSKSSEAIYFEEFQHGIDFLLHNPGSKPAVI